MGSEKSKIKLMHLPQTQEKQLPFFSFAFLINMYNVIRIHYSKILKIFICIETTRVEKDDKKKI